MRLIELVIEILGLIILGALLFIAPKMIFYPKEFQVMVGHVFG